MTQLTRTILACEADKLLAAQISLANVNLPGLDDVGEGRNLTPDSQKVTLTRNGVTTTFCVVELWVPPETAIALEKMFDPKAEDREAWDALIDKQHAKAVAIKELRAKVKAGTATRDERASLREAVQEPEGDVPDPQDFRRGAKACRFWDRGADERRSMRRFFEAPARAEQGWSWVDMPQPAVPT
jgi:hypothetical protein